MKSSEATRTFRVETLGCKANFADSAAVGKSFLSRGWIRAEADQAPDVCVINSCAVTDEADRETRRLAGRLLKKFPSTRVLVTGCSAEVAPERLAATPGIRYVVGNRDRGRLVDLLESALEVAPTSSDSESGALLGSTRGYTELHSVHPMDREWPSIEIEDAAQAPDRTRVFLKIQEGCNSFCTYCVIPYGRGPSRSLDSAAAAEQVRMLAAEGIKEVVLTGTNLGDYGESGTGAAEFTRLVERLLDETPIERLRLSSLDPSEIEDRLLERMAREPRLCPHFHVSLQSTEDRILRLMKRKYRQADASRKLRSIAQIIAPGTGRRPFVGMDLITGFPSETEQDFAATIEFLRSHPWNRLHVFPYSERAGTPATRLPNAVYPHVRAERAKKLQALSLERMRETLGEVLAQSMELPDVLLERPTKVRDESGQARLHQVGYTPDYLRVIFDSRSDSSVPQLGRNERVTAHPHALWIDSGAGDVAIRARFKVSEPSASV